MRTYGFSAIAIKDMMGDAFPVGIEWEDPIKGIDYMALAGVMEVYGKLAGAKRFDSNLMQLYTIENFLTPEECEKIIALAEPHLAPSTLTHSNGDPYFRTSSTCNWDHVTDPFAKYIDEKISKAIGIRLAYSEPLQVQHYEVGQELKAHHDFFPVEPELFAKSAGAKGQRTWTFMVYLNDVPKGGGTHFVYLNQTFQPKQGMAVVWNNLFPDGGPNRHTRHQGMPVEEGKKAIITKWFREKGDGGEMLCSEEDLAALAQPPA